MVTDQLIADDVLIPDVVPGGGHPMDASHVLFGLMQLSRRATGPDEEFADESLEGIIAPGVLRSLLSALHFRDVASVRHTRRVAQLAVGMAGYLGWEGRHLKVLEVAALLHDIGKVGVPDNILFKPSVLSPDEADLMALHHAIGYDVLQACRVDKEILDIVGHLRDPLNSGPGRNGRGVPMGSRILAVADAYDSLRTDQVYRKGKTHDEIMRILMDHSATQFDANIIRSLARWTQESGPPSPTGELLLPGPTHPVDAIEASSMCHIFSFLYLMESLYDGFFLVDGDLRFVVWNAGAERLLGRSAHDMVNCVWSSRVLNYADDGGHPRSDEDCSLKQVLQSGRPHITDCRMQHEDGRWLAVETQTVPLLDELGQIQGVAEILRDRSRTSRKPQEYHSLRLAATRDGLTGVANRGELETQMTVLLSEAVRTEWKEPFSIIFLDVDHFKQINDRYGHTAGDKVLIEVTRAIQQETYSGELLGRYGGEEFVILCPGTNLEQAVNRANRVRVALMKLKIPDLKGRLISASFGTAEAAPGDSVESLLRRADKALYTAKRTGRNRTCSLTLTEMSELNLQRDDEKAREKYRVFIGSFVACIPSDMVVYKLGGFVNDEGARLLEVAPSRAVVRLGSRGLLPFWGSTDDMRPVDVEILFGDEQSPNEYQGRLVRTNQVQVTARVRPVGWIRDGQVFEARARRALKKLCAYFAADLRID